jgi:hypothetical protein
VSMLSLKRFQTFAKNIVESDEEDKMSEASSVNCRLSNRSSTLNLAPSDSSGSEFKKSTGSINKSVKRFG